MPHEFQTPPEMPPNPLAKYFRMPGLHVRLPTNGVFMPPGSVEFTVTGEVPVYPLRGADEVLLKSPDALMSGYAIEKMLESCVPAIKAPRLISSPDLDVLLLAVRAATYGETIKLEPVCPACGAINEAHRNLSYLMSTMTTIEPENPVRLSDEVVAYVRPHNLGNATRLATVSFEETRKLQAVEQDNADQERRSAQVASSMERLTNVTTEIMAECILAVVVPEGQVTDRMLIWQFLSNVTKAWTDRLQAKLAEINARGISKKYNIECAKCHHNWEAEVEFNPSSFFDPSS